MTFEELLAQQKRAATAKSRRDGEHRIQCACVRWFNLKYPTLRGRLFAVPNGGRRDRATGARLKGEGVVPGVADLILLKCNRDYGALLIEMKTGSGRQSQSQKTWQENISSEDEYKYVVCHSTDDFIREVTDYLRNI